MRAGIHLAVKHMNDMDGGRRNGVTDRMTVDEQDA